MKIAEASRSVARKPREIVTKRPAETATPVAMAAAALIGKAVGVDDPATVWQIAIVVAFVPFAVSWLVDLVRG